MIKPYVRRFPEVLVLGAACIFGLLFFALTNPQNSAPVVLVVGFIILLVSSYCMVRLAARALKLNRKLGSVPYNGIVVAVSLLPVMLLALQSIGQLTPRDVITLIILFLAGYFYVTRLYVGGGGDRKI